MSDPSPPRLSRHEQQAVATALRDIIGRLERGELTAPPGYVARLEGVALTLEGLAGMPRKGR